MILTRRTRRVSVQTRTDLAALSYTLAVAQDGSGDYTTIEAAVAAANLIAPDASNPLSILLASGTYTLADNERLDLPAHCRVYAIDPSPANTIIDRPVGTGTGSAGRLFQGADGTVLEGFTIRPASSSGSGNAVFTPTTMTEGSVICRRLIIDANGEDSLYLSGGGDYEIDRCDISVNFDGIAVFGAGRRQVVTVKNSLLRTNPTVAQIKNLIRVDNANALVRVLGSKLQADAHDTTGYTRAISSGLGAFGIDPVAYDLEVIGSLLSGAVGASGGACGVIAKHDGTLKLVNSQLSITGDRVGTDYALWLDSVVDYEPGAGIIDTTISAQNATLAQTQLDSGGNSAVTGFPVS